MNKSEKTINGLIADYEGFAQNCLDELKPYRPKNKAGTATAKDVGEQREIKARLSTYQSMIALLQDVRYRDYHLRRERP